MVKIINNFNKLLDKILYGTGLIAVGTMVVMATFVTFQILSRYGFGVRFGGLFDGAVYALIVFSFLSIAYAQKEDSHIKVTLLTDRIGERAKNILTICTYLLALLFPMLLGWYGTIWALEAYSRGVMTVSEFPIPRYILISMIPIGSFLLLIQMVRQLFSQVHIFIINSGKEAFFSLKNKAFVWLLIFLSGIFISLYIMIEINIFLGTCVLMVVLFVSGLPIFLALSLSALAGLFILLNTAGFSQMPFFVFRAVDSFPLAALPLFMLAGKILEQGKIVERIFIVFEMFLGRFLPGLLLITILIGFFLCAVTGSSIATTAILAAVMLPLLIERGYDKALSAGVIAGSTVGTIIPPSVAYILFGVATGVSVGQLFIAGIIPGVMIFSFYIVYILIRWSINRKTLFEKREIPAQFASFSKPDRKLFFSSLKDAALGILMPFLVIGGIYLGIFTPTEAAAFLVVYAIIICVFVLRTMTLRKLFDCFVASTRISAMVISIVIAGTIFAAVVSQTRIAPILLEFIVLAQLPSVVTLLMMFFIIAFLDLFMSGTAVLMTTVPVFYPIATVLGFDPLWFGVFYTITLEIGQLTPPVGLVLFAISSVTNVPFATVLRGVFPFFIILVISLVVIYFIPDLVTWLPAYTR